MTALNKQARQVQRYTNYGVDMMEWDDGKYVKYSDYLAMLDELEAAKRRIAELEARTVTLPDERFRYGESDYDDGFVNGWNAHGIETKSALRAAGIGVKGELDV